jgi:ligand-binding SRPBCC domain-containing protein
MARIVLTTRIRAPVERCFDLARSIDLHVAASGGSGERAVAGVVSGLIGLGERVTWRARHFGVRFEMTSEIAALDRPRFFRDRMIAGPFSCFEHDHTFEEVDGGTVMRDDLRFEAPFGPLGRLAARYALRPHLAAFLAERNTVLKRVAESTDDWRGYVDA